MKATHTLDQVRDRIREFSDFRTDLVASASELRMSGGSLIYRQHGGYSRQFTPSPWAESQICAKLGIPVSYFRKCPNELQDSQFTYWMSDLNERSEHRDPRFLLRGRGPNLWGFLSSRYACLDNADVLTAVEPLVEQGMVVTWFEVSDLMPPPAPG